MGGDERMKLMNEAGAHFDAACSPQCLTWDHLAPALHSIEEFLGPWSVCCLWRVWAEHRFLVTCWNRRCHLQQALLKCASHVKSQWKHSPSSVVRTKESRVLWGRWAAKLSSAETVQVAVLAEENVKGKDDNLIFCLPWEVSGGVSRSRDGQEGWRCEDIGGSGCATGTTITRKHTYRLNILLHIIISYITSCVLCCFIQVFLLMLTNVLPVKTIFDFRLWKKETFAVT